MNINFAFRSQIKILYLLFFFIFILFDYLVRINVFGDKFKLYYLRFTSSNILLVSFTFFVITYLIFYITGAFDLVPSLITAQCAESHNTIIYMVANSTEDRLNTTPVTGMRSAPSSDLYPNYPLNLLYDIETLVNVEVIVLMLLTNIFAVQYLINRDYTKYIPDNKFGKYLNIFLNKYIAITYSKSNKFIIGLCVFNLIICIIFSKVFLYYVMNPK